MKEKTMKVRRVMDIEETMTYENFVKLRSSNLLRKCKSCDAWFDASQYPDNATRLKKCVVCYTGYLNAKKIAEGRRHRDREEAKKRQSEWDSV